MACIYMLPFPSGPRLLKYFIRASRIDRSCAFVLDGSAGDDMNDAAEYASREQSVRVRL